MVRSTNRRRLLKHFNGFKDQVIEIERIVIGEFALVGFEQGCDIFDDDRIVNDRAIARVNLVPLFSDWVF